MASSPKSEPGSGSGSSPPPAPSSINSKQPSNPPLESPPKHNNNTTAPPPTSTLTSTSSPPPPLAKAPPPPTTTTSPPPKLLTSPPPPSPPTPPSPPQNQSPPSPQGTPPPASSPPPPASEATPPSPSFNNVSPPPSKSPPRAPTPSSPNLGNSPEPPSPTFTPPPPVEGSTTPPAPPNSSPTTPANSSAPSMSIPSPTPRHETPPLNVSLHSASPNGSDGEQTLRMGIAVGIMAAVIIIGLVLSLLFVQRKKRHNRYMMASPYTSSQVSGGSFAKQNSTGAGEPLNSSSETGGIGNSMPWFTYEELSNATNGFASENILGAGGFGCVYKGCLQDGLEVAVKKLKDNSGQRDREFKAEVEIISRVHHRHLVSLVGYCITDSQRLLAYEFVPNNTLHHHLYASNKPVMPWTLRVKVACGSAHGIAYLHEDCHPRIIHRDIKSSNILLDNNFEAKVADFGLAKLAQELESNTHVSTRVMGTFGYMAPEYASSGKLTEKSDVFSFGVVLLELITGRKPVDDTRPLGDESLVEWARPLMSEALESQNFDELVDPRLQGNYDNTEMFQVIEAAAACVRHSASKRPKMSQVVRELDTIGEISDISNGVKPGQSGIYDSREQSVQIRLFQKMAYGSQDYGSEYLDDSREGSWTNAVRSTQA